MFVCCVAFIRAVLRHSSLVPEGDRGGEHGETLVWSILPCGFLWTGKTLKQAKGHIVYII